MKHFRLQQSILNQMVVAALNPIPATVRINYTYLLSYPSQGFWTTRQDTLNTAAVLMNELNCSLRALVERL